MPRGVPEGGGGAATVLWCDPGETTGWAVISVHPLALVDGDVAVLDNITHWEAGQIDGGEWTQAKWLCEWAEVWPDAAIGAEDFILRTYSQQRNLLSPVRLTAAWEYAMWLERRRVWKQQPADAKVTCSDERLRAWKMLRQDHGPHARDALRHALLFLRRCKERESQRVDAWPRLYR